MRAAVRFATLAAIASAAAAVNLPTFPVDWTAIVTSNVVVNQGGVINSDGTVCCDPYAPECKVQTGYQAGKQLFDYTGNRTAFLNPDNSGVITLVDELKQYAVNASGYCQSYCPIPEDQAAEFLQPLGFPQSAKDMGQKTYKGQVVEDYQWLDQPLFNITFETTNFYVNIQNFSSPVPVFLDDQLTPFGMPLGFQQQAWHQFVAGRPSPNAFVVEGKASCPMSQRCEGENDDRNSQHDDFNQKSATSGMHRFEGVKNVDFIVAHLHQNNKLETLEQSLQKALPKGTDAAAVLNYYRGKLPQRMLKALA